MKQYLDAVREILTEGTVKENRTGVNTLSTFGVFYKIDLSNGRFPLLTTKKISWKNIVVENLWFLSGEPKIDLLKKHGCKFWDAWAEEDGSVPSAYGNFWTSFPTHQTITNLDDFPGKPQVETRPAFNNQIEWVVDQLKTHPMSRRLVVSAWAPGNAQISKLPPCHIVMVFNVQNMPTKSQCATCDGDGVDPTGREPLCGSCFGAGRHTTNQPRLCLHLTQRSCDIALGVPYNIAGYAFLLELMARVTGLKPGIFAHTLVDAHAYTSKPDGSMADYDHVPGLREQLTREIRPLPKLVIDPRIQTLDDIKQAMSYDTADLLEIFKLEGYNPHPKITFKVAV